jgi:MFS family permease
MLFFQSLWMFLKSKRRHLSPVIWALIIGAGLIRLGLSMSMPFLTLFLTRSKNLDPVYAGIVVGAGSFAFVVGGFVGGPLCDKFGKKQVLLTSLSLQPICYALFGVFATHFQDPSVLFILFTLLNFFTGNMRSWFETSSNAMISEFTGSKQKTLAFGLRYLFMNVGYAIGPILGSLAGLTGNAVVFYATGSVFFLYFFILSFILFKQKTPLHEHKDKTVSFIDAIRVMIDDKIMRYFVFANILLWIGHVQLHASFPLLVDKHFAHDGFRYFAFLLAFNAFCVVFFQFPANRFIVRTDPLRGMMFGVGMYAASLFLMGLAQYDFEMYMLSMLCFSIGEVCVFPLINVFIDKLASARLRGSYFGVSGLMWLGNTIGPSIGGGLFQKFSAVQTGLCLSCIVLISLIFFYRCQQMWKQKETDASAVA